MRNGPFEHNEINNYLWNRQGKRHYWGIIGKDYGFLESTSLKKADNPSDNLSDLKNYHIQLRRNPY